jgi:hypothetical protein
LEESGGFFMSARSPSKREAQSPEQSRGAPVDAAVCKPYLSISELAKLTPWTDQAIRTMISRGIFREREHYFYVGRRPVFNWSAVVGFIEQGPPTDRIPH